MLSLFRNTGHTYSLYFWDYTLQLTDIYRYMTTTSQLRTPYRLFKAAFLSIANAGWITHMLNLWLLSQQTFKHFRTGIQWLNSIKKNPHIFFKISLFHKYITKSLKFWHAWTASTVNNRYVSTILGPSITKIFTSGAKDM